MDLVTSALLGSLVGAVTGLLPGLHVNTLAAVAYAAVPDAGPSAAVFLLSIGTVHTIVNILPATYLGVPDADDVVAVLPAHRLLLEGRGPEAVRVSVAASLVGAMGAVPVGFALHGVMMDAVALGMVDRWTPVVLLLALVALWVQERHRGVRGPLVAAVVCLLAGLLGALGTWVPLAPLVEVPPSPLLPLLGGLFGAAGLSMALQRPPVIPLQQSPRPTVARPVPALLGSAAAGLTALMPGLTSAVATAMMPGIRGRPLHAVAAMSAVNTAHLVLATVVWMSSGRVRTGLSDAMGRWAVVDWIGTRPGPAAATVLAVMLATAVIGALTTVLLDRGLRRCSHRLPSRALSFSGLVFLSALVLVLGGWPGLLYYVIAALVGRLPLHLGVRRVHLVGALIIPALAWHWT